MVDLGINCEADTYIAAIEEHEADILGMSALLTTTMPYMKVVIDEMKERGIRDDYIVLVGGAPLNEEFGEAIGANAYCRDAATAVETAKATWSALPETGWKRSWSSPAAPSRASWCESGTRITGTTWNSSACRPSCTTGQKKSPLRSGRSWSRRQGSLTGCSWLMPIAAPADAWTGCWRNMARSAFPGAHCYEFYSGSEVFSALAEEEPGSFFLTDFLVRHFERLVWRGLGLDRQPDLLPMYFGNYRRVIYLGQEHDEKLQQQARQYAERLGLEYVVPADRRRSVGPDPEARP